MSPVLLGVVMVLFPDAALLSLVWLLAANAIVGGVGTDRTNFRWLAGQGIGLFPTLVIGVVGGLSAFLPVLISPVRSLTTLPDQDGSRPSSP